MEIHLTQNDLIKLVNSKTRYLDNDPYMFITDGRTISNYLEAKLDNSKLTADMLYLTVKVYNYEQDVIE